MLKGGIWGVFFYAFSSKKAETKIPWNHSIQSCSEDFQCCSFTGKERDEETGYGYFGARYMDHELMTSWLSVDPMSDRYPSISPYAYCAWNPVKLVDPNGREIFYKEGDNYYVYKKNSNGEYGFYNYKTGKAYSGNNQQFINELSDALGQLKEGKHGNSLVSFFEGDKKNHIYIRQSKKNGQQGTAIKWNNSERTRIPIALSHEDPIQSELSETFLSLGHEMAHARDMYNFKENFDNMSREEKEQSAMFTENLIRREHGYSQRSYYGLKSDGITVDFKSWRATIIPPNPVIKIKEMLKKYK